MDPFASGKGVLALHRISGTTEMTSIGGKLVTLLVTPCTGETCLKVPSYAVISIPVYVAI
jgi:hypothetical protein